MGEQAGGPAGRQGRRVSGGLSNIADIEALCAVEKEGVQGVICGRSIYTGDLDFAAGQRLADERNGTTA